MPRHRSSNSQVGSRKLLRGGRVVARCAAVAVYAFVLSGLQVLAAPAQTGAKASPGQGATTEEVKGYLVSTVQKMKGASADFVKQAETYAALVQGVGGADKVWAAKQAEV